MKHNRGCTSGAAEEDQPAKDNDGVLVHILHVCMYVCMYVFIYGGVKRWIPMCTGVYTVCM